MKTAANGKGRKKVEIENAMTKEMVDGQDGRAEREVSGQIKRIGEKRKKIGNTMGVEEMAGQERYGRRVEERKRNWVWNEGDGRWIGRENGRGSGGQADRKRIAAQRGEEKLGMQGYRT